MLISRVVAVSLAFGLLPSIARADGCTARDYLAMPLPETQGRSMIAIALETAYPGLKVDDRARTLTTGVQTLPLGIVHSGHPRARLANASIVDQFSQIYPLAFDLTAREKPWFDPGRARNDSLFRALYGQTEAEVAALLKRAEYQGPQRRARFAMNRRHCAARQLQAALDALLASGENFDRYFTQVGGSFNWRRIAGTQRLSSHSFGIAVDFNTQLGGYWRWSGATEGNAETYDNRYPAALVRQMERFGFIWGGKWHHFDGMHFEYRPELILYARLKTGSQND